MERHITERTRAIIPVHSWGCPTDMDGLMALAARQELVVIEDCGQSQHITTGQGGMVAPRRGRHAVLELAGRRPALCVSSINEGANVGLAIGAASDRYVPESGRPPGAAARFALAVLERGLDGRAEPRHPRGGHREDADPPDAAGRATRCPGAR